MNPEPLSRRQALKRLGAIGAGAALAPHILPDHGAHVIRGQDTDLIIAGAKAEITVTSLSATTVRLTVQPLGAAGPAPVAQTGALAAEAPGTLARRSRSPSGLMGVRAGNLVVRFTNHPPTIHVDTAAGAPVQRLTLSATTPRMTFLLPNGPLLGMGEGGPQFDRKGNTDAMRNGQGAFRLATHGTRAPVQWLVGTDGWGMFIHQPYGAFDLTASDGVFTPASAAPSAGPVVASAPAAAAAETAAVPLDVFITASHDPAVLMQEYARITGFVELPARWTLGYQQSHRTLNGPDEILRVARTLRDKKLPCDTLIYLGTEFTPSGWNTRNGEFTWKAENFPDPARMISELHDEHFKVVLHIVIEGKTLTGTVRDACTGDAQPSGRTTDNRWPPDRQVPCYWPHHKALMDVGVDGWWPDQGDGLDGPSRLNRHRMYWEGSQQLRPNARPFALHRNASPGIQRFGGYIWSGDVQSRWETLKTHVPIGINCGLSGFPLWGTDIGGFIPTAEYTGELYLRWFQFGAFCPLFRAHGRNWHLHLPWGWSDGFLADGGPAETNNFAVDPAELHNAQVEPICRKYLELRSRLMPYLYTAVRDCSETGLPVMRALWLHHPDDHAAVARGDQYLWGRDILVAPVVEKGATARQAYLPRGGWTDFWTEERVEGGRETERPVDLATMPLWVRAGAVVPMGPVRQYVDEPVDESGESAITLVVYPGVSGRSTWYEDDGRSFAYRRGESMRVRMDWDDASRRLTLQLAPGSQMFGAPRRRIDVRVAGSTKRATVEFAGTPVSLRV
jgi:alpha-glucosidase (family GH31 glycosyl hydrolase)